MTKRTMTKRFYASKSAVEFPTILQLKEEATETAKRRLIQGNVDEYYVVEVVRVIRRTPPPIIIEDVRK